MTTVYITHPDCLRHEMGAEHPERPQRLVAIDEHLRRASLLDELRCMAAPLAEPDDLKRVHAPEYVDLIFEQAPTEGYVRLDPDTLMNPHSLAAARRAAGAGILAVEEVVAGRAENAFCAIRPCGHHATRQRPMGFCIFNNVAVAAAVALERMGLERVAIVDFDVHHGNGTEDIFAEPQWQERVLMVGLFQHPFYPGSGVKPLGSNMINIPLAAGADGPAARQVAREKWLPALEQFKPQLILISAGFDAHRDDLLGGLGLVEDDYVWMTQELMALAARHSQGRIVSMLEGGYNLDALGSSTLAHVRRLSGEGRLSS
ncbi:MAG TPA: histone deacetylase family protein [Steroidobacteraceae bacterium]